MPDHFINLNCANCGGKLEIYEDMNRFACGYCGTEQIVQRRGGTVALKAVTEAIQKVQIGTDKTAAELAIVRLEKELLQLRRQRDEQWTIDGHRAMNAVEEKKTAIASGKVICGVGMLLVLVGSVLLVQGDLGRGVGAALVGAVIACYGYSVIRRVGASEISVDMESSELKELQGQVNKLENQIVEKRKIANG